MKVYETVIPQNKPYERIKYRKCDLCGHESRGQEWEAVGLYGMNDTEMAIEIRQKEGTNYPEGGSGTKYEIDLCPTCFKDRLIPWLKSQGADIKTEEWDW